MDLSAWRSVADDESFASEIVPFQFLLVAQQVVAAQHGENSFRPKLLDFAIRPMRGPGNEGNVEAKLPNGRNVIRRIAVDEFDPDLSMAPVVCT